MIRRHTRSASPARRAADHDVGGESVAPFVPGSLAVGVRQVRVGHTAWVATVVVTGYPRQVHPGWLQPLTSYPGRVDVAVHINPIDPATATTRLRRLLARLESGRRFDADHGRLADPHTDAAAEDAHDLADRLARGETRLYQVSITLTVHATTEPELAERVAAVRGLAASLLLDTHPATYRALPGWVTGLPLGLDRLGQHRVFDTDALAAAFPFASAELPSPDPAADTASAAPPGGVLYGYNLGSGSLVFWDRFGCDNYNTVVLGRSGAGKSYLVKLELLRSLYQGVHAHVIDPENEYVALADAVGGHTIALGRPGVHLNPFDLPITEHHGRRSAPRDALTCRALFLHTFLEVLLGQPLSALERAVLDTAIGATYTAAGITTDPQTWDRPAPLLADLRAALTATAAGTPPGGGGHGDLAAEAAPTGTEDAEVPAPARVDGGTGAAAGDMAAVAGRLAAMLHPFTDGAYAHLFSQPTTTSPDAHLVVWSLRDLPEPLRAAGTLLALDAIWTRVTDPAHRRPRLVVVDEAWLLLQQPAGAQFLLRTAKAGRKHWAGLTLATQDTTDVLGSDLGRAVVTNAATQILLRQAPQAIDAVVARFGLSAGERAFLLSAGRGEALLTSGIHRVAFHAIAADAEHQLITTDPRFLASHPDLRPGTDHVVLPDRQPHPDVDPGNADGDGAGDGWGQE